MGLNCRKASEPLRGGSLLFTTKFPEIPGTHLIDLGKIKGWVDLGATHLFWTWDPWIGNQRLNHYGIAPEGKWTFSKIPEIKHFKTILIER